MAFDQYGYICHFNQECRCQVADCDYCGWNPDVSERRLEQFLHGNQDKEETTVKKIVDLNPIIKELADWCLVTKGLECSILGTVIDRLRAAPAVDAVEVVRCKDCKHWHEETEWCDKHSHFVDRLGDFCYPEQSGDWKMLDADDYCSYGERKDNDI